MTGEENIIAMVEQSSLMWMEISGIDQTNTYLFHFTRMKNQGKQVFL